MPINERLQKRICELIVQNQTSLYKMSKISGMPESTLRSIVNGSSKNPKLASIAIIAMTMEISIRDIFDSDIFD